MSLKYILIPLQHYNSPGSRILCSTLDFHDSFFTGFSTSIDQPCLVSSKCNWLHTSFSDSFSWTVFLITSPSCSEPVVAPCFYKIKPQMANWPSRSNSKLPPPQASQVQAAVILSLSFLSSHGTFFSCTNLYFIGTCERILPLRPTPLKPWVLAQKPESKLCLNK